MRDKLYLMKPGFVNADLGPFYCGDSVAVEGLLGFFPELRDKIDVFYLEFPRPRQALVDALGDENQSIPVLILSEGNTLASGKSATEANGYTFITDEKEIREHLSLKFNLPQAA